MGMGQRVGFLAAPLLVGTISDWRSLRWSFAVVAAIVLAAILSARTVLRGNIGRAVA